MLWQEENRAVFCKRYTWLWKCRKNDNCVPRTIPQQQLSCHAEEFRSHFVSLLVKNYTVILDCGNVPGGHIHSSHLCKEWMLVVNAVSEASVKWMPKKCLVGHRDALWDISYEIHLCLNHGSWHFVPMCPETGYFVLLIFNSVTCKIRIIKPTLKTLFILN